MADQRPSEARKTTSSPVAATVAAPPRALDELASDVILRVLCCLHPRDVVTTSAASKSMRRLSTDDVVWCLAPKKKQATTSATDEADDEEEEAEAEESEWSGVARVGRRHDVLVKARGCGVFVPTKRAPTLMAGIDLRASWYLCYRDTTFASRLTDTEHKWSIDTNYPEGSLRHAVELYCKDQAAAEARYGRIETWDTSHVTDMRCLFFHKRDFDADISRWDVGQVKDMHGMCKLSTPVAPLVLSAPSAALTSSPLPPPQQSKGPGRSTATCPSGT